MALFCATFELISGFIEVSTCISKSAEGEGQIVGLKKTFDVTMCGDSCVIKELKLINRDIRRPTASAKIIEGGEGQAKAVIEFLSQQGGGIDYKIIVRGEETESSCPEDAISYSSGIVA